jgi:hypothetical protein
MRHGEGDGLRQVVVPVAEGFPDDTRVVSVEVWDHGVVVRWAKTAPEPRVALTPPSSTFAWLISDDRETEYTQVGGHGGHSNPSRPLRGEAEFEPAPPADATVLRIRRQPTDEPLSVSLTD